MSTRRSCRVGESQDGRGKTDMFGLIKMFQPCCRGGNGIAFEMVLYEFDILNGFLNQTSPLGCLARSRGWELGRVVRSKTNSLKQGASDPHGCHCFMQQPLSLQDSLHRSAKGHSAHFERNDTPHQHHRCPRMARCLLQDHTIRPKFQGQRPA